MKKTFLLLVVFSFISVMPSFGIKLITNNNNDRTVPSRCSGYEFDEYTYNQESESNNAVYKKYNGYQGTAFDSYYKPILSKQIRKDLIGTTWYYSKSENPQDITEQQNTTKNTSAGNFFKNNIREAADYYYIDTITDPKTPIAIGY